MSEPLASEVPEVVGPSFYLTPPRRLSRGAVLLAVVIASGLLVAVVLTLGRARAARAAGDDDDDPSRVDTIYLSDAREAPVARRPAAEAGEKPATVHPFVVVHLPRSGEGIGQIPDSPAGRLLYRWLAAFNGSDPSALGKALPTRGGEHAAAAQWELRQETGGFTLLSAKEVQPGVLVFRLVDQSPAATEVLGTLEAGPAGSGIVSFSLRAVPAVVTMPPKAR